MAAKLSETKQATEALGSQFDALNIISEHENVKAETKEMKKQKSQKTRLVTFNLSENDVEKYKRWIGSKGISMSMGIRMCLDYIFTMDKNKELSFTNSGIRQNKLMGL